jgi:hypothetical protein
MPHSHASPHGLRCDSYKIDVAQFLAAQGRQSNLAHSPPSAISQPVGRQADDCMRALAALVYLS